jgi:hypothetical protein
LNAEKDSIVGELAALQQPHSCVNLIRKIKRELTMLVIQSANLALRFVLELCMLAALGYWGYQSGEGWIAKAGLAIGAPLLAAVTWGVFISPKALAPAPTGVWLGLQAVLFGCAAAGLAAAGHPALASVLGLLVVINGILMYIWRQ